MDIFLLNCLQLLALSLAALVRWRPDTLDAPGNDWPVPVIVAISLVLVLTIYLRLKSKYDTFQPKAGRPVNGMTVAFLYEDSAHPRAYLKAMTDHYGNRKQFAEALDRYLDDPDHCD